jgi:hypothetical protein
MYWISSESVEIGRKCCNEGFSFSSFHLRDSSIMKGKSSYKLNIVVYHVPIEFFSRRERKSISIKKFCCFADKRKGF